MSETELESLLLEGGARLLEPPADVDELIDLLDQVESCLSKVEQSPTRSTLKALEPSRKALISEELLKHTDMDVKIAVASCISEVTRITAPEAPYDDDLMKEIFHIIVNAFEGLFDMSSRSYNKRVAILETVAKVRSCVVMLDLECDDLILEMFQHFIKAIRDDHPDNVFSSMLTIMTLVLEESEEISSDLLGCLLRSVKKEDQDLSPIARQLGAKVIASSAVRIKPFLLQDVKLKKISLDDYNTIVTSIYHDTDDALVQNGFNVHADANENNMSPKADDDKSAQGSENVASEDPEVNQRTTKSPTPVVNNVQIEVAKAEKRSKGRKPKTSPTVGVSDPSQVDGEKDAVDFPEQKDGGISEKNDNISVPDSPATKERASPLDHDRKLDAASPTKSYQKSVHHSQPATQSDSSTRPRRGRPPKRKSSGGAETPQSGDGRNRQAKKSRLGDQEDEPVLTPVTPKLKESDGTSDSDVKNDDSNVSSGDTTINTKSSRKESTSVKEESERKRKSTSAEKAASGGSSKQKMGSGRKSTKSPLPELKGTPKASSQKKRGADMVTEVALDETLVGSKIEVYWPEDKVFYRGVVDSFDPVKKKHRILYVDGDEEILRLEKERWRFISVGRTTEKVRAVSKNNELPELPLNKTTKTGSEKLKQGRSEESSKRGSATRNKSKGDSAAKTGGKLTSGDADKASKKSKDKTLKADFKLEDDSIKSKFDALKNNHKTKDGSLRTGSKMKDRADGSVVKTEGEASEVNNKSDSSSDAADNGDSPTTSKALENADSKVNLGSSSDNLENLEKPDSEDVQDTDRKSAKKRRKT